MSIGEIPAKIISLLVEPFYAPDITGITPPEGMMFKEWNSSADGLGDKYAPGEEISMPTGGFTLYAVWANPVARNESTEEEYLSIIKALNDVQKGSMVTITIKSVRYWRGGNCQY